jgi:hypothetical protein
MPKAKTSAQLERERVRQLERDRELRIRSWAQARNEGIREGLTMAITSLWGTNIETANQAMDAIRARGDRHFGDSEWQKRPRTE